MTLLVVTKNSLATVLQGFRALELRVQGFGFWVLGLGIWVLGLGGFGFWVLGFNGFWTYLGFGFGLNWVLVFWFMCVLDLFGFRL